MTERFTYLDASRNKYIGSFFCNGVPLTNSEVVDFLNENEQLKSTIKKVIELLGEEVDVFSEKATEHDLNAYRELQQLDNKDAYYIATAIKKAIKMLKGDVE